MTTDVEPLSLKSVSCDSAARLSLTHPWHNSTTFLKKENGLFWLPATILLVDNLTTGLMLRTKWYTAFCSVKTNHFPFYSSLSLDELLWLNRQFISAIFPQKEKGSVWLQTTFRWWQLTIELISTFTQWISVNQLTTCLSFYSRTWRPMYPEILESILSFYQKSKIFQESNMVRPVFLAGWDLHFLMELPFGWIWQ